MKRALVCDGLQLVFGCGGCLGLMIALPYGYWTWGIISGVALIGALVSAWGVWAGKWS